jgi:hypothetical protein
MRRDEVEQRVGNSCGARITPDQLDIGDVKKLPGGEDSSGGCFTRTNKFTLKILVLEIVRKQVRFISFRCVLRLSTFSKV